jgi:hypothetical protein
LKYCIVRSFLQAAQPPEQTEPVDLSGGNKKRKHEDEMKEEVIGCYGAPTLASLPFLTPYPAFNNPFFFPPPLHPNYAYSAALPAAAAATSSPIFLYHTPPQTPTSTSIEIEPSVSILPIRKRTVNNINCDTTVVSNKSNNWDYSSSASSSSPPIIMRKVCKNNNHKSSSINKDDHEISSRTVPIRKRALAISRDFELDSSSGQCHIHVTYR